MKNGKEQFVKVSRKSAVAWVTLALWMGSGGAMGLAAQGSAILVQPERQATVQSKFYCNIKALTPEERARHKQLSEKLMTARKEIVETEKGYEFQFSPGDASVAELADWVVAESKCCPFFDFHIDLENLCGRSSRFVETAATSNHDEEFSSRAAVVCRCRKWSRSRESEDSRPAIARSACGRKGPCAGRGGGRRGRHARM